MKHFIYALVLTVTVLAGAVLYSPASSLAADCSAQEDLTPKQQIQCGANTAAGGAGAKTASKTAQDIVVEVINVLTLLGGALAVIMIIFGGFRYVTSAGNQEATKSAKNTIIYAVIGLVIIAVAQVIVQFVLVKSNHAVNGATPTSSTGNSTSTGSGNNGSASQQTR